ncbi:hypothetical protein [Prosthecomicrobium pneumaticum]|uniref:Uncharacterized protein n=1 Tax=Prosthecomicrobium pneumaticum TaxID=81895 RepID=A0A7W9FR14_9HYPH|nr:hypothetical protein [Prosthecomicrobium pneumaticum]MBB5755248.1 hypothetical protein [Prosthecomicrobium pneumaticum]
MVDVAALAPALGTVEKLVDLLDREGELPLRAAVWALVDENDWRLFLVPRELSSDRLRPMIKVAWTLSEHSEVLPERHRVDYSVVGMDDPVLVAIAPYVKPGDRLPRELDGLYGSGRFIEKAIVLAYRP